MQPTYAPAQPPSTQVQHFDSNSNTLISQPPKLEALTVNNGVALNQHHRINEKESMTGFASSKLAYKDESADIDAAGDGWGDDAWGDDWGGELDDDTLETGISGNLPETNESGTSTKDVAPAVQLPPPPEEPAQTHQQVVQGLSPTRRSLDRPDRSSSPMKTARDLQSAELDIQKHPPAHKTGGGLNIPSAFGEQGRPGFPDQQSQRRPSSDVGCYGMMSWYVVQKTMHTGTNMFCDLSYSSGQPRHYFPRSTLPPMHWGVPSLVCTAR